jgi:hypothetical protein
MKLNTQGQ